MAARRAAPDEGREPDSNPAPLKRIANEGMVVGSALACIAHQDNWDRAHALLCTAGYASLGNAGADVLATAIAAVHGFTQAGKPTPGAVPVRNACLAAGIRLTKSALARKHLVAAMAAGAWLAAYELSRAGAQLDGGSEIMVLQAAVTQEHMGAAKVLRHICTNRDNKPERVPDGALIWVMTCKGATRASLVASYVPTKLDVLSLAQVCVTLLSERHVNTPEDVKALLARPDWVQPGRLRVAMFLAIMKLRLLGQMTPEAVMPTAHHLLECGHRHVDAVVSFFRAAAHFNVLVASMLVLSRHHDPFAPVHAQALPLLADVDVMGIPIFHAIMDAAAKDQLVKPKLMPVLRCSSHMLVKLAKLNWKVVEYMMNRGFTPHQTMPAKMARVLVKGTIEDAVERAKLMKRLKVPRQLPAAVWRAAVDPAALLDLGFLLPCKRTAKGQPFVWEILVGLVKVGRTEQANYFARVVGSCGVRGEVYDAAWGGLPLHAHTNPKSVAPVVKASKYDYDVSQRRALMNLALAIDIARRAGWRGDPAERCQLAVEAVKTMMEAADVVQSQLAGFLYKDMTFYARVMPDNAALPDLARKAARFPSLGESLGVYGNRFTNQQIHGMLRHGVADFVRCCTRDCLPSVDIHNVQAAIRICIPDMKDNPATWTAVAQELLFTAVHLDHHELIGISLRQLRATPRLGDLLRAAPKLESLKVVICVACEVRGIPIVDKENIEHLAAAARKVMHMPDMRDGRTRLAFEAVAYHATIFVADIRRLLSGMVGPFAQRIQPKPERMTLRCCMPWPWIDADMTLHACTRDEIKERAKTQMMWLYLCAKRMHHIPSLPKPVWGMITGIVLYDLHCLPRRL